MNYNMTKQISISQDNATKANSSDKSDTRYKILFLI